MFQKLNLALVTLVVIQTLHFIIWLNRVSPDQKVDVERLIEWVAQCKISLFARSNLYTAKVNESVIDDLWLRDVGKYWYLQTINDIGLHSDDGIDILDNALDPVAFGPRL